MENPVILDSFPTLQDASIVSGMLEANGIATFVSDRNNLYVPIFGGVDLYVDADNLEKARRLLEEHSDIVQ